MRDFSYKEDEHFGVMTDRIWVWEGRRDEEMSMT
jgi:hypothetical protein